MHKKVLGFTVVIALFLTAFAFPVAAQDDLVFPIGEDDMFNWSSLERFEQMDLSGQEVRVFGPWLTVDQELVESVFAYFEQATGADVIYTGSDSFEQQIIIDIEGGSPPDLAVFPQPGLAANVASRGNLIPLGEELEQWTLENYAAGESWLSLGTYENAEGEEDFFGFFYKVDVKSLVWYVPDNLADAGYDIPTTMEELIAVSDDIVANGETPWCIGLGSGDATGWPATDWVEDIMLRTQSPDVYDQWVTNEIPFNDERIVNAIEIFGSFAKNDEYVNGGAGAVAATDFRDSPQGLFEIPPQCYFHHQASFIPSFFPEDAELGIDVDFFYFPPFESEDLGSPVLGAGTLWAAPRGDNGPTELTEATAALLDFLTTPLAHEIWMAQSGFLTPHTGVNLDAYANSTLRGQGEILQNATTFRFDASDLMPGAIGAGAFWTGMVDYVSNPNLTAEEAATQIQEAWDELE